MRQFTDSQQFRRLIDRIDQVLLVALYIWFCYRLLPHQFPPEQWYTTLILVSEGMVLVFVLLRHQTDKISVRPREWMIALFGTAFVLLVDDGGDPFMPALGQALMVTGVFIHVGAKLSLRRSFGIVAADRGIKSAGLYRFIRHPMYFGYFISHFGFLLAAPSVWNAFVYCGAWILFIARIFAEERILSENPDYRLYQAKVRYRLIPMLF